MGSKCLPGSNARAEMDTRVHVTGCAHLAGEPARKRLYCRVVAQLEAVVPVRGGPAAVQQRRQPVRLVQQPRPPAPLLRLRMLTEVRSEVRHLDSGQPHAASATACHIDAGDNATAFQPLLDYHSLLATLHGVQEPQQPHPLAQLLHVHARSVEYNLGVHDL